MDNKSILKLKNSNQPAPQSINDEAGLGPEWQPVDAPPIVPGVPQGLPDSASKNFTASLPPAYQHDSSFVGTAYKTSNAPAHSLMPLGLQGSAITNSAIQSTAVRAVAASGGTASTPVSISFTGPSEAIITGSPANATGAFNWAWAVEPATTVFAAPGANAGGFDASFAVSGGLIASTGVVVTTAGGQASVDPSWALYIGRSQGTSFGSDPVGWTAMSGHSPTSPIMQRTIPSGGTVSAVEGAITGANTTWATNICYFAGALPTVYQATQVSTGGLSSVSIPLAATAAGHSLLVVMSAFTSSAVPNTIFHTSYSITDSQNLTALQIADSWSSATGLTTSQSTAFILPGTSSAAETVTVNIYIPVDPIWGASGVQANISVFEISTTTLVNGIPRFRLPQPINLSAGLQGTLPPFFGGTGANLQNTGGANKVVQQLSAGAAFTVAQLGASNLTDGVVGTGNVVRATATALKKAAYDNTSAITNLTATTLFAVLLSGLYRLSYYVMENTVATTSTLPNIKFTWTDQVSESASFVSATPSANTLTTGVQGSVVMYASASTNIQFQTGDSTAYATTGTNMQYTIHLALEAL